MKNKWFVFGAIYLLLGIIIFMVLNRNISDIKTNKDKVYSEYFEMKEIIDLYSYKLIDCGEINVILTKNLQDDMIKIYEKLEIDYYLKNNQKCVEDINLFVKNFAQEVGKLKYNEEIYKKSKETQVKKKILKENLEKMENNNGK